MQGPFSSSFSYQNDRDTQDDEVKWMIVSATWDFGVFKLHAAYDHVDNNGAWLDGITTGTAKQGGHGVAGFVDSRFWSVGGAFKATPQLTISAQYYDMKEKVFDTKSKVVVVDADYALSKRTFLYAMYGYVDNNMLAVAPLWGNQNFGLITKPTLPAPLDKASTPPGAVAIQNDKASAIAIGIRHVF
jgi:predicted porin